MHENTFLRKWLLNKVFHKHFLTEFNIKWYLHISSYNHNFNSLIENNVTFYPAMLLSTNSHSETIQSDFPIATTKFSRKSGCGTDRPLSTGVRGGDAACDLRPYVTDTLQGNGTSINLSFMPIAVTWRITPII